ncbi:hypothetical protein ABK040_007508 [Willaertia magna]
MSTAEVLPPTNPLEEDKTISWDEIRNLLPSDVFQPSSRKAWLQIGLTLTFVTIGVIALAQLPWYFLPVTWFFVGLCASGLFGVAYACSQERFFNSRTMPSWVNSVVGTICMLPLLYPFESFKTMIKNTTNNNNTATNKKEDDDESFVVKALLFILKSPFWFLSSIWEWITANIYFESRKGIVINAVVLYVFAAAFFSLMIYFVGLWGLVKFYIGPLIAYHLINSTFMKVNEVDSKKNTITNFPSFIEFLTNNANHSYRIKLKWRKSKNGQDYFQNLQEKLYSVIPNYNWGKAKAALKEKFEQLEGIKFESLGLTNFGKVFENEVDLRDVDWFITLYLFGSIIGSIYGIFTSALNWKTYLLSFIGYQVAGIGISAGYHRVFAHKSCNANFGTKILFILMGTSAFQGSVLTWSADHRRHHMYIDTPRDPYNIKNGFFYAHMGWLIKKREVKTDNATDLLDDPILQFQHKYYPYFAVALGYIAPMLIAGLGWGDWYGGFFIGGILSKTVLQHCTFFINSLAHTVGAATFNDDHTARDSYIVSFFTFGEGFHNFHHTFEYDYRNGLHWHHYDPGKWLIYTFSLFGWTFDLKRCNPSYYEKGRIVMEQKQIDERKKEFDWGTPLDNLPTKSWEEFENDKKEKQLMIIDNVVHDVSNFIPQHPGGEGFIKAYTGKDASKAFHGDVYKHTNIAKNILAEIRIYKLPPRETKEKTQ